MRQLTNLTEREAVIYRAGLAKGAAIAHALIQGQGLDVFRNGFLNVQAHDDQFNFDELMEIVNNG
jgi:hypothetical protein